MEPMTGRRSRQGSARRNSGGKIAQAAPVPLGSSGRAVELIARTSEAVDGFLEQPRRARR